MSMQKEISQDRWPDYLSQVTAGNRGRHIAVDVITPADVSPEQVEKQPQINIPLAGAPFLSLEYESVTKGNAIIISAGVNTVEYEHAVDAPVEMMANQNIDGRLDFLEILDQNGACTRLNFIN